MIAFIIDNTHEAWITPLVREAIKDAINNRAGQLPEELADLFVLSPVIGNTEHPENAWRIDWA